MFDIDIVIPWVDGGDPAFRERMVKYAGPASLSKDDVAGPVRFADNGELQWCVASINRYAPFVRRIYIITDGQDPCLGPFLEQNFKDGCIPVEVVDHKVIFRGYEEYLPVFNSRSIETMMWRIPGLSEHFVLMNDDFLILKPLTPDDFFTRDGKVVAYVKPALTAFVKFEHMLKPSDKGRTKATFKASMIEAARIVGFDSTLLYLSHCPRPLLKSTYEDFFSANERYLLSNIRDRFRTADQFNSQELTYLLLKRQGRLKVRKPSRYLCFLQPGLRRHNFTKNFLKLNRGTYSFCCFNSIEKASQRQRTLIEEWVKKNLAF